jgi:hypothetical protein
LRCQTHEESGSDSERTGSRDGLGDGNPSFLDGLAVLAVSQLGAQLGKVSQPGDGEVLLVQGSVEETLLSLEDRGEDVRFAVAISLFEVSPCEVVSDSGSGPEAQHQRLYSRRHQLRG